jgi:hypothetical protein
MHFLKKITFWAVVAAVCYFILSYHFIVVGNGVKLLKKSNLTLNYTIFSTKHKKLDKILDIDDLREDGIGKILVEAKLLDEEQLEKLMSKYQKSD